MNIFKKIKKLITKQNPYIENELEINNKHIADIIVSENETLDKKQRWERFNNYYKARRPQLFNKEKGMTI
jgi:hypothetical protein